MLEGTTAADPRGPRAPGRAGLRSSRSRAREEKVVELRYEVRYPRGFPIAGLE